MGCLMKVQPEQCTRSNLSEMQEEPGQKLRHNVKNFHAPEDLGETHEEAGLGVTPQHPEPPWSASPNTTYSTTLTAD